MALSENPPKLLSVGNLIIFYTGMTAVALILGFVFHKNIQYIQATTLWRDLAWGIGFGVVIVGLSVSLSRNTPIFDGIHRFLRPHLGGLSMIEIILLSLFSAMGEEFFFRGFLQTSIGWIGASLIFGLIHLGPTKEFFPWTLFALSVGLLLGYIKETSLSLTAPILIHFLVNWGNITFIVKRNSPATSHITSPS